MALVVKNPRANAGATGDVVSMPGLGRSPGGGHGNPLQYSCLKNPMYRGALQAVVQWVTRVRHDCAHIHADINSFVVLPGKGGRSRQMPFKLCPNLEEVVRNFYSNDQRVDILLIVYW